MTLSVIVPVHNERLNIGPLYHRASAVLSTLKGLDRWSIVFINNASDDGSLEEILALRALESRVKVITLSRRFDYHAVLVAGLSEVESDLYAIVDVDCEDPPELLKSFYEAIQEGVCVAYGIRSNRREIRLITWGRKLFYKTLRRIADAEIVEWMGEFVMMTRPVRDAILAPQTTYPFLRAELGYVGFTRMGIPYVRAQRQHGQSHYNLLRMTRFAIGGILASSTFPLRLVLYLAAAIGVAFPIAVWVLHVTVSGAAILAAIVLLYFVLISVSLVSLYVGRVYKNVVARPVFIVDGERTFLDPTDRVPVSTKQPLGRAPDFQEAPERHQPEPSMERQR